MAKKPRMYNGEKTVSSMNGAGKTGQPQGENETKPLSIPYSKINRNCIKGWNARPAGMKVIEKIMGHKLSDIGLSNILANLTSKARETKATI